MLNFDDLIVETDNKEPENICIVRVTTDYWSDSKGLYSKKSIKFLKRQCKGWNILEEDCSAIGADFVINHIENLDSLPDGVYQVVPTNLRHDWETGYVDDYDYSFVKLNEE